VCLGDPGAPVVGAHVAVDVEEPLGVAGLCQVVLGQGAQQLVGPAYCGQLLGAPAKGLDLRGAVKPEQASEVDGVDARDTASGPRNEGAGPITRKLPQVRVTRTRRDQGVLACPVCQKSWILAVHEKGIVAVLGLLPRPVPAVLIGAHIPDPGGALT